MAQMTKENIEKAIRDYLQEHLELIPQLEKFQLFDVKITSIDLGERFAYVGSGRYPFKGRGEGWKNTTDGGKSNERFRIQESMATIGEGPEIVKSIDSPVLIEKY